MRHYLLSYSRKRKYLLLLGDIIVLFLAVTLSYAIRIHLNQPFFSFELLVSKFRPLLSLVILSHLLTLYLLNQYTFNRPIYRFRSSVMVVMSIMLSGLIISTIFFFFPKYIFGRQVLLIHLVIVSLFMVAWRLIFKEIVVHHEKIIRLAIIGSEENILRLNNELERITNNETQVVEIFITQRSSGNNRLTSSITQHNDVDSLLDCGAFDILLFDYTDDIFTNHEIRRILQTKHIGKSVFDLPTFYKSLTGKVPLNYIDGRWLLNSESLQGQISKPYIQIKRFIDILLATFLIIPCAPLFVIIGVFIKLDSKGDIIFSQERLGFLRRPFKCYKFRTMVENAEKKCGPVWACKDDPRVTELGKFLRKSRLDELPQLWNIIKGNMSFVGPRPIREHFADQLAEQIPFYEIRFSVKPGLSGWAQVNYDYAGSEVGQLEKFQYELFYIQNISLFLDIMTVFKTAQMLLKGKGQ